MQPLSRDQVCLTDGVITLHPVRLEHAEGFVAAINESLAELRPWMSFAQAPATLPGIRDWIEDQPALWERGLNYAFAVLEAGAADEEPVLLGGCGFNFVHPVHRLANLIYWVRTSRCGEGIATRLIPLLAGFGFRSLGLNRIEIVVAAGNHASLRVAEKAGALREGLMRNRILLGDTLQEAIMHSLIPGDLGLGRE
ncbi:MAG: GNAT family N-acetyltransferase [Anaerolineales bacterium]|nr:GNAT family N-acetyltransferase [Anaerolineales bacterium]